MPVKHKLSSLESLAKNVLSRLLLAAISRATKDSDLSETEEICQVLGCLDALYTPIEMRETSKEKAAGAQIQNET